MKRYNKATFARIFKNKIGKIYSYPFYIENNLSFIVMRNYVHNYELSSNNILGFNIPPSDVF